MMRTLVALGTVLLAVSPGSLHAQGGGSSPIQLSLVTPIQLVGADRAITGFRLNLIYGQNTQVVGLDIGLINRNTSGVSQGLQYGLVNLVEADFKGWQHGGVNLTRRMFEGLQSGAVNSARAGRGVQWGIVNVSDSFNGLQIGFVNYAERMHGLQIGLVNIISQDGAFPVFPIVNWSF